MIKKLLGIILLIVSTILSFSNFSYFDDSKELIELEQKIEETSSYFAILEIPKLHLKKELYSPGDSRNQVDQNLFVQPKSTFPGYEASHVIIAGHSGTGKHAYFHYLYKLKVKDIVILDYDNKRYYYEIKEIEKQEKTGTLALKHTLEDQLTLITCSYQDEKHQTIYYSYLQKIENIAEKSEFF